MKKINKIILLFFIIVFLLYPIYATAETLDDNPEWDTSNTVTLEIKSDYVDEVLEDVLGAFSSLDLKNAYIFNKYEHNEKNLHLLLILNEGGDAQQDAAVDILKNDLRVKKVEKSCDAYFETVNTLKLTASSTTIKQGETVVIKPEGDLKIWHQSFEYDEVIVGLNNYDKEKEYTLADFPHFDFISMEKSEYFDPDIAFFYLKLAQPSYFNIYKAINILSLDPNTNSVQPNYFSYPAISCPSEWKISDNSIADFVNKDPDKNNDKVVVKGLKPGKVTITYIHSDGYWVSHDYPVSIEITVEGAAESGEPIIDPVKSPKTGNSYNILAITMIIFITTNLLSIFILWKRQKKKV